jgi:pimeloyl-ACP methyl ester carboxylesterase
MQKVTSKDGTAIAFDKTGHGPAVILVSGALGDRSAATPLTPLLSSHFTVFAYDRRGRGDSGDIAPYAVEREIEDIDALIKETDGSAFVYGHSSGAALALEAVARGLSITSLALYEPPFIVDDTHPPLPKDYAEQLNTLVAAGRRGDAVEFFMRKAVGVPDEMVTQMRNSPMWADMEKMAHTLAYDGKIMGNNMTGKALHGEQWASVTIPTLVMDGGASPEWARNAVQALADALPNAQRRTLEGQTHGADPAILAPVLVEFFGRRNER